MRYVYVQNGAIVEGPVLLPKSWKDVSNFNVLDNQTLKEYGWYPHRFVPAIVDETVVITGSTFSIEENEVVEYQTVRLKTDVEIAADIEQQWVNVRSQRNIYMTESDWTQLVDSPIAGTPLQEEWKVYRQALRDITNFPSPDQVVWPQKPEYTPALPTEESTLPTEDIIPSE